MNLQDRQRQELSSLLVGLSIPKFDDLDPQPLSLTTTTFGLPDLFKRLTAATVVILTYTLVPPLKHPKQHYPTTQIRSPRQVPLDRFRRTPDQEGCSFAGKVYCNY
ncbi:hypothetical protein J4208_04780 [Candidatus Woesearchaeota archaeon]|nr:hypothetical protein [Candidatus Woesearchaeota archaeon]